MAKPPLLIPLPWAVFLLATDHPFAVWASEAMNQDESRTPMIPPLTSAFGSYPDLLGFATTPQDFFHPIVRFPRRCWNETTFICPFSDYSKPQPHTAEQLLDEATFVRQQQSSWVRPILARFRRWWRSRTPPSWHFTKSQRGYVGRYDEDRIGLYASTLFGTTEDDSNRRTVHVGLDLAGRVGTPVYSCCENGVVVASGYNAPRGDYGHVVVLRYQSNNTSTPYFYVLYGHLDSASSRWETGEILQRGEVIGWLGGAWENGGWTTPHVHVQVSVLEPITHDMPGAVRLRDREKALQIYLDPRYIVGNVH